MEYFQFISACWRFSMNMINHLIAAEADQSLLKKLHF